MGVFDCGYLPYTYSDATGLGLRNAIAPQGTWTVITDSTVAGTTWANVSWNADTPAGTEVIVRVASSADNSTWSGWETVASGNALSSTPDGRYLKVEATLKINSGTVSPVLYDLTVNSSAVTAYTISASPTEDTNPVMTPHTITATIDPVASGVKVGIEVTSGPNAGTIGTGLTDASGQFVLTYTGDGGGGTDVIRAWVDTNGNGSFDEGEPFATVTKDWLVNYVTGGTNIKEGKGKPTWTVSGNVGFLDDGNLTIKGNFHISDHETNENWKCHNAFSSLVFSGPEATSPVASHNTATFTGTFTNNKTGETKEVTIVIVDQKESGKKTGGDSITATGGLSFASGPGLSTGNFQVHDGYR